MVSQSDLLPMTTETTGGIDLLAGLLLLRECEALLAIEGTQCIRLDDVVTGAGHLLVQRRNLGVRNDLDAVRSGGLETAPVTIRDKRFRHAAGPDDRSAVIHHTKLDALVRNFIQGIAEHLGRLAVGPHIEVDANDLDLLELA